MQHITNPGAAKRNVLLAGGTGYIGLRVLRQLCHGQYADQVRQIEVLSRSPERANDRIHNYFKRHGLIVPGSKLIHTGTDLRSDRLPNLAQAPDIVINASGLTDLSARKSALQQVNVAGAVKLLKACIISDLNPTFVHVSSTGAYGSWPSMIPLVEGTYSCDTYRNQYCSSKLAAELDLVSANANHNYLLGDSPNGNPRATLVFAQPGFVIGEDPGAYASLFSSIASGRSAVIDRGLNGKNVLPVIDVGDCAGGIVQLAFKATEENDGRRYILAYPGQFTQNDILQMIANAIDARFPPRSLPLWAAMAIAPFFGSNPQHMLAMTTHQPVGKMAIADEFGFAPEIHPSESIKAMATVWEEQTNHR